MMREISLFTVVNGEICCLTYWAASALGYKIGKHGGIRVPGCGMDMGFHIVYSLSSTLYHDDFPTEQGYALKQRWL
jgi:hypothetical protein